jgi:large subunit ribosomal protein L19
MNNIKNIINTIVLNNNNKLNVSNFLNIKVGNFIIIKYLNNKNNKNYIQTIEGLIISKKNGINSNITIKRIIDDINITQIFFLNSPKIISIVIKNKYKIRKSKLYFLNNLKNKYKKLKTI